MATFFRDLRHAGRSLRKRPGFTAIAVLTLALGIGANTAIFSVVNELLLQPLPFPEPDRLVEINHHYPSLDGLEASISVVGYQNYSRELESFEDVAVQTGWGVNLTGDGEPQRLTGMRMSASYFSVYGVSPARGRAFRPEEETLGRHRVALLSHGLWTRRFGADPDIVGRVLTLNDEPYEIVGVMPRSFRPFFNRNAEIFAPLAFTPDNLSSGYTTEWLTATGRLASGVTLEQARGEIDRFVAQLKSDQPDLVPEDWSVTFTTLNERARGDVRPALLVLLGAVGFVLLIACANIANLLLARAASRAREVAVRLALGARPRHLVRQLLSESVLLAVIGGAVGLLLAYASVAALVRLNPGDVPRLDEVGVDPLVIAFTAGLSVLTGIVFGLIPALQAARTDVERTLRDGGGGAVGARSGALLRRGLVVAEFALALSLLAGAGLLVKSFARLTAVDPGFEPEHLLTFHVAPPQAKYPSDTARVQFFDALTARLETTPGVEAVAATTVLPFSGSWTTGSFTVEGYEQTPDGPRPWGDIRIVNPDFAEAMGIPLLRGRFLEETDRMGTRPVVVVDEEMVRRFWPDEDPIGKRIFDDGTFFDVVGVVGHAAHEGLDADPRVQLYFPYKRTGPGMMYFALRTRGEPNAVVPAVREAVRSVDPDQPISRVSTMEELMADAVGPRRFAAVLLGAFAFIALLLATTGVYGVMSYLVAQRTGELGVRVAMGAGRRDVVGLIMRNGLKLAGLGVGIGLVGALGLTRLMASQLYQVRATDPATYGSVAALLLGVAALATFVPALRATRVDPVTVLRRE